MTVLVHGEDRHPVRGARPQLEPAIVLAARHRRRRRRRARPAAMPAAELAEALAQSCQVLRRGQDCLPTLTTASITLARPQGSRPAGAQRRRPGAPLPPAPQMLPAGEHVESQTTGDLRRQEGADAGRRDRRDRGQRPIATAPAAVPRSRPAAGARPGSAPRWRSPHRPASRGRRTRGERGARRRRPARCSRPSGVEHVYVLRVAAPEQHVGVGHHREVLGGDPAEPAAHRDRGGQGVGVGAQHAGVDELAGGEPG